MNLLDFFDKYETDSSNSHEFAQTIITKRDNLYLSSIQSRKYLKHHDIDVVISVLTEFERNLSTYIDITAREYKLDLDDVPKLL